MGAVAHVAGGFADLVAHLARGLAHPIAHFGARLARAAAHRLRHQLADFLAEFREPVADVFGNALLDFGNCALDFAQSFADAAFHVAGDFAHDSARESAALGDELAGGVEHAAHESGNLAAKVVDEILERRRESVAARER